jgi:AcrR family transcriptional regulator
VRDSSPSTATNVTPRPHGAAKPRSRAGAASGTRARAYAGKSAELRRVEQRERLLSAGRDVFSLRGYAQAGIDEIVARARVSRTSFYEHFDNKEQCLLAVFAEGMARMREALAVAVRRPLPPLERIRVEVETVARTFADDPAMARVMLVVIVGATPAAERAHIDMRAKAATLIEAQLEGYPHWRQRSSHERHVAAIAAMAAIAEPVSELVASGRIAEWETIVDPVVGFVAHGLIPSRGS